MADRVGQQLGNYRLVRLLGRGGFAEVYVGEHRRLGTQAAVKVLYARLATPAEVEAFEKEAHTIAHLSHPHIVRVFDFDVQDDIPFLVMDYATGGTLRQRHPKGSILPLPTIISYVKQVADALQYAHDQRLIHRDIKPENMLLGQHDEVLLSDFGIATIAHHTSSQSTQAIAGTAPYMAPEQMQGKPRPSSDQYALGVVVYEWLSGSRPFNGTATEIAMQHVLAPIPSLRENGQVISPHVEQVVITALAKDPKQRFSSVQAFAAELEQASQSDQSTFVQPIISPPLTSSLPPAQYASASPIWRPDNKVRIDESQDENLETHNVRDAFLGLFLYALSALAESPSGLIRYILGTWFFGLFSLGHMIVGVFSIAQLFGLFFALFPLLWSFTAFVFPSGGGPLIRLENGVARTRKDVQQEVEAAFKQLIRPGVKRPRKWYVSDKITLEPPNALGTTLYISQLSMKYPLTPTLACELGHFNSLDSRLSMARRRLVLPNLIDLLEAKFRPRETSCLLILTEIIIWLLGGVIGGGIGLGLTGRLWSNYLKLRDFAADRYAAKLGQASALIAVLESAIRNEYMPVSLEEPVPTDSKAKKMANHIEEEKEKARKYLAEQIDRLKGHE